MPIHTKYVCKGIYFGAYRPSFHKQSLEAQGNEMRGPGHLSSALSIFSFSYPVSQSFPGLPHHRLPGWRDTIFGTSTILLDGQDTWGWNGVHWSPSTHLSSPLNTSTVQRGQGIETQNTFRVKGNVLWVFFPHCIHHVLSDHL
jgi:hypothetical protein